MNISTMSCSYVPVGELWDVVVIGSGPAGALAARQAARAGLRTLLVDHKSFPRQKVCGGYLNRRALAVLNQIGLAHVANACSEGEVHELELRWRKQKARFHLPAGRIICRTSFDADLVDSARLAGVTVMAGASAVVEPEVHPDYRSVTVVCESIRHCIDTRLIICADGLSRTSVRLLPEFASIIATESRVGIGSVVTGAIEDCPRGKLMMVMSRRGYVGISRIDSAHFNVAAAVDRVHLQHTTPLEVVSAMLKEAGIQLPQYATNADWKGTPPLTSRPKQVASERVILVGDAGGYVEPFTGEGMAAAMETAVAVVPLALQAAKSWSPSLAASWETLHWQMVRRRQRACKQLAWILRRPWAAVATLNACRLAPGIATRLIATTSAPPESWLATGMSTT